MNLRKDQRKYADLRGSEVDWEQPTMLWVREDTTGLKEGFGEAKGGDDRF